MKRLNQILAIEKGVKNRNETIFTQVHQSLMKSELLNGLSKTYQPREEDGEKFPAETKKVQLRAEDQIDRVKTALIELFDVSATKDMTNCLAKGDVVVDGVTILKAIPATHLLFIEKKLVDLLTFVRKLPVLDQADDWSKDPAQGLWTTKAVETFKTKKVVEHVVVVPATDHHPAQVKEAPKDVIQGTWTTVKYSGALPVDRVEEMAKRVEKLQQAVKFAREAANSVETVDTRTGAAVLDYIFDGVVSR